MTRALVFAVLVAVTGVALAQSQYAGQQSRSIKSLSQGEIDGYLAGAGMGFAKVAELNSYPGPKHVLELAAELELTAEQRAQTEAAYDAMHERATALGSQLVDAEQELESAFAARTAAPDAVQDLIAKIASLRGEIRFAHVEAHLKMSRILAEDQIATYDRLRGYTESNDD